MKIQVLAVPGLAMSAHPTVKVCVKRLNLGAALIVCRTRTATFLAALQRFERGS